MGVLIPTSKACILSLLTTTILSTTAFATPQAEEPIVIQSSAPAAPAVPIAALLYTRDAGPKTCHGSIMTTISIPRPISASNNNTCTDLPQPSQCGIFMGDTSDSCEARLYSAPGCPEEPKELYVTTVVFRPDAMESTPQGGWWKSVQVRCGVWVDEEGLARAQENIQKAFAGHVKEGKSR